MITLKNNRSLNKRSRRAARDGNVELRATAPRPIGSLRADSRYENQSFEGSVGLSPARASALRRQPAGPSTRRYVCNKMNYLSPNVKAICAHYFPSETEWAITELQAYCIYMAECISEKTTLESYERFCFAVLKLGKTSKEKFTQAIELGKCDYRDLLVAAGFGNSVTIHNDWVKKILIKREHNQGQHSIAASSGSE